MTTLVLFARQPVPGRCKTRLIPALGEAGAARLYEAMLGDCMEDFGRLPAGRRVLYVDGGDARWAPELAAEEPWELAMQPAGDLAIRLLHAIDSFQAPILFLGSDAPLVPLPPLAAWLRNPTQVALGPARDGGYWTIGLPLPHRQPFHDVPWGTSRVLEITRSRCREARLAVQELPESFDIDEGADLAELERALAAWPERAARTRRALTSMRRGKRAP